MAKSYSNNPDEYNVYSVVFIMCSDAGQAKWKCYQMSDPYTMGYKKMGVYPKNTCKVPLSVVPYYRLMQQLHLGIKLTFRMSLLLKLKVNQLDKNRDKIRVVN